MEKNGKFDEVKSEYKNIKIQKLSFNPYSIILDENNPGNLLIYGMGFEEIPYS